MHCTYNVFLQIIYLCCCFSVALRLSPFLPSFCSQEDSRSINLVLGDRRLVLHWVRRRRRYNLRKLPEILHQDTAHTCIHTCTCVVYICVSPIMQFLCGPYSILSGQRKRQRSDSSPSYMSSDSDLRPLLKRGKRSSKGLREPYKLRRQPLSRQPYSPAVKTGTSSLTQKPSSKVQPTEREMREGQGEHKPTCTSDDDVAVPQVRNSELVVSLVCIMVIVIVIV